MAMLPSGFIVSTTGVYTNYPTEKIGGVAAGVTSATTVTAGQPLTSVLPLSSILPTSIVSTRRSRVLEASGTAHAYSAQKAVTAGTFAYDQDEFMIMGVTDTINGSANTKIKFTGGDGYRQRTAIKNKDRGYGFGTAFRAGYFRFTGTSTPQRTNWSTAPSPLTNMFQSTKSAGDASDEAQYVTWRSVPGELTYMGASGVMPFTDNYKAVTG